MTEPVAICDRAWHRSFKDWSKPWTADAWMTAMFLNQYERTSRYSRRRVSMKNHNFTRTYRAVKLWVSVYLLNPARRRWQHRHL